MAYLYILSLDLRVSDCWQNVQIEDAEEEKGSVHLKDVIKGGEGVTTMGFGADEAAGASAAVSISCLYKLYLAKILA